MPDLSRKAGTGAGETLVSRTVRDLVVGTGFEDRGSVKLRGVPGTWQLLAVDRHGARAGSAEAEIVSTPTPGARIAMRRSDRAVAVMAPCRPAKGRLQPTGSLVYLLIRYFSMNYSNPSVSSV